MRLLQELNTYISLREENNRIQNAMIFLYACAGHGKTLAMENIIEEYHRAGYTILILSDVKDEFEFCFSMFEAEEPYQINHLIKIGKPIESKKIKIYHPFSFAVPKDEKIPEIQFYGFSLKDMKRSEWSMIAETEAESDTVRLLLNCSNSIDKTDGLYSFLQLAREFIRGGLKKKSNKFTAHNFYLDTNLATSKSLVDLASYFQPFKEHYFFTDDNSDLKLNWKDILNDNQHYHVFTSRWIDDEKLKSFCVATLFQQIIRNTKYTNKPILIVIPEIRKLVPEKQVGFTRFVASVMRDNLSIMRNKGIGMSGLFDSQVWEDVNQSVKNSATENFFGQMGGGKDLELISKSLNYRRDTREFLKRMPYKGTYLWQGHENQETFIFWMPGHMHKEEHYRFLDIYKRKCPEKMKNYKALHQAVLEAKKMDEEKVLKKIDSIVEEEKELKEEKEKIQSKREEKKDIIQQSNDKVRGFRAKIVEERMQKVYLLKNENPNMTWREIGSKVGIFHATCKRYFEKYSKFEKE